MAKPGSGGATAGSIPLAFDLDRVSRREADEEPFITAQANSAKMATIVIHPPTAGVRDTDEVLVAVPVLTANERVEPAEWRWK